MDPSSWTDLVPEVLVLLNTPLLEQTMGIDAGPSVLGLLDALIYLALAPFMWWWVARQTRHADTDDHATYERLSYLGLRVLAVGICLGMVAFNLGLLSSTRVFAAAGTALNAPITSIGGNELTVSTVVILIAVVIGTLWGTGVVYQLTIRTLESRGVDSTGTVGVLLNLGRYALIIVGLAVALTTAGINLTALFTLGAVFAVTIGFALQNISQNFVSGIILLVEGAIQPGDVLEVEGRVVRVVKMGVRSTVVRSMDDEDMILPNALLAQGTVKNLTMDDDSIRIHATVSVAYDADLDEVKQILEKAAWDVHDPVCNTTPVVLLQEFGDSGILFEAFVWVGDPWTAPRRRSDLRLAIWRAFREHDVTIPFPQVDVHLDPVALMEREAG